MAVGRVEILSSVCCIGWAEILNGKPPYVAAYLHSENIGATFADFRREDLEKIAEDGGLRANAFVIVFNRGLSPEDVTAVEVRFADGQGEIWHSPSLIIDRFPPLNIFIFGSPRSGTSELGHTLTTVLEMPWLGEGHAAPLLAAAAAAMGGNEAAPHQFVRFLAYQRSDELIISRTRQLYYFVHSSASFIDKTPGFPAIKSASFLARCFPDAKFIYLRRNGIANLLSRMTKFGGDFGEHCADWVAAVTAWLEIRDALPSYLEIDQQQMLDDPHAVGKALAVYLGNESKAEEIGISLRNGRRERTGAGLNRDRLVLTGWSEDQKRQFVEICGPTMTAFGYDLDLHEHL